MNIIYFLVFALPIIAELSPKIDTSGLIRIVALCTLSVGGLLAMSSGNTNLICVAIVVIYSEKLIHHLFKKQAPI